MAKMVTFHLKNFIRALFLLFKNVFARLPTFLVNLPPLENDWRMKYPPIPLSRPLFATLFKEVLNF